MIMAIVHFRSVLLQLCYIFFSVFFMHYLKKEKQMLYYSAYNLESLFNNRYYYRFLYPRAGFLLLGIIDILLGNTFFSFFLPILSDKTEKLRGEWGKGRKIDLCRPNSRLLKSRELWLKPVSLPTLMCAPSLNNSVVGNSSVSRKMCHTPVLASAHQMPLVHVTTTCCAVWPSNISLVKIICHGKISPVTTALISVLEIFLKSEVFLKSVRV